MKRRLLLSLALVAAITAAPAAIPTSAPALPTAATRGSHVGWARLVTPDRNWNVHRENDARLASFIRTETTLNLDPQSYSAHPAKLDELCTYPLLYVKNLAALRERAELENVRQYLRRGGFLCVDACTFVGVTPDTQDYFRLNCERLRQLIPTAEVKLLPEDHAIYRSYFPVHVSDLFTPDTSAFRPVDPTGLYGVFDGPRMIAVVSMHSLQCGWPQAPRRVPACMKMLVNIYVYAMTR